MFAQKTPLDRIFWKPVLKELYQSTMKGLCGNNCSLSELWKEVINTKVCFLWDWKVWRNSQRHRSRVGYRLHFLALQPLSNEVRQSGNDTGIWNTDTQAVTLNTLAEFNKTHFLESINQLEVWNDGYVAVGFVNCGSQSSSSDPSTYFYLWLNVSVLSGGCLDPEFSSKY